MKYNIKLSHDADRDYLRVKHYLSQFYENTFNKFFVKFEKLKTMLTEHPRAYPVYEYLPEYRRAVLDNYIVLYKLDEQARMVEIHRIFPGSLNFEEYIKQ
ncbi:MAG: type II toxin-antitoxin system RelE/ParE family toxin [Oscillospiraceae bacterium]|nr:type II toxin-antitoxin system RelE/ParE family toxin [Oscillospiraceae bacterium]